MKISQADALFFDRQAYSGNLYIEKKDGRMFGAFFVECYGRHPKVKLSGAARCYFITEGAGTFSVNDVIEPAISSIYF